MAALCAVLLTALAVGRCHRPFMDKWSASSSVLPGVPARAIFENHRDLGLSKAIVSATIRGSAPRGRCFRRRGVRLLTYGGVSLFVVVFAVYPFAAELFRQSDIPKRLIPGTIALGAFTFTMDALPGTPQIQNIIPTAFFGTDSWAAPILGTVGGIFILSPHKLRNRRRRPWPSLGLAMWRRCSRAAASPGCAGQSLIAILRVLVGVQRFPTLSRVLGQHGSCPGDGTPHGVQEFEVARSGRRRALVVILTCLRSRGTVMASFAEHETPSSALCWLHDTASEYGFGAVIAACRLPASATPSLDPNPRATSDRCHRLAGSLLRVRR